MCAGRAIVDGMRHIAPLLLTMIPLVFLPGSTGTPRLLVVASLVALLVAAVSRHTLAWIGVFLLLLTAATCIGRGTLGVALFALVAAILGLVWAFDRSARWAGL